MNLGELLPEAELTADADVVRITERHDRVRPGSLFSAIGGRRTDGSRFAAAAVERGAAAILTGHRLPVDAPQAIVSDVRAAHGLACQRLAGDPSHAMAVVGITGTDGKTTTGFFLQQILSAAGAESAEPIRCGLIGTVGIYDGRSARPSRYTTPPAEELATTLAAMRTAGCTHAVLELSSQGLEQRRAEGIRLAAAVWTNFARDHLDHHGHEAAYWEAKARIASLLVPGGPLLVGGGVPHRDRLSERADCRLIAACGQPADDAWAEMSPTDQRSVQTLRIGEDTVRTSMRFAERHDLTNATMAAAAAAALGIGVDRVAESLAGLVRPPGRMQALAGLRERHAILVDYAHTPAAVRTVLDAAAEQGRPLTVVIGAGGDRDAGKRSEMGAACRGADRVVVTSDNPRSEDPAAIADALAAGVPSDRCERDLDRASAIRRAIEGLGGGGTVLIAGKGHEATQTVGGRTVPFDDRLAAIDAAAGAGLLDRGGPLLSVTIGELAEWIGGRLCEADPDRIVRGMAIASRDPRLAGRAFVGLPGRNGHGGAFAHEALTFGAAVAVVPPEHEVGGCVVVDDPASAMRTVASRLRDRLNDRGSRVVAITGSVGKTTARQLLTEMLTADGRAAGQSPQNYNTDIGVPLTLANAPADVETLVVEVAAGGPGDIAPLAAMLRPDVAILTAAAPSHLDRFESVAEIAEEKLRLAKGVEAAFLAVDAWHAPLPRRGEFTFVGRGPNSDIVTVSNGGSLRVGGIEYSFGLPAHLAPMAATVAAAARHLGVSDQAIGNTLATFALEQGRGGNREAAGRTVIDETYNASPLAVRAAAERIAAKGGTLVVGDMLGLGGRSEELHRDVGRQIASLAIRHVVSVGPLAAMLAEASGIPTTRCDCPRQAAAAALAQTPPGGWLLVKGSRGMRMERVIAALEACDA